MAGNSMIALMLMLLLCFIGMLVMFLFVIRSNTVLSDSIKEATRQQRQALHDIERQLLELSFTVNRGEVKEVCAQYAEFSTVEGFGSVRSSTASPSPASMERADMRHDTRSHNANNHDAGSLSRSHENGWGLRNSGDLGDSGNLMGYGNMGNQDTMRSQNTVNPKSTEKPKNTMNINYDEKHAGYERQGSQVKSGYHKEPATEKMAHTDLPKLSL